MGDYVYPRLFAFGQHVAVNPGDRVRMALFTVLPPRLAGLLYRILGPATLTCEHIRLCRVPGRPWLRRHCGRRPAVSLRVREYRGGRLVYGAVVLLCRECAASLP